MSEAHKNAARAPALESGLTILEMAARGGVSFSELLESLSLSRGSVARLLKVLQERGYLKKDADGRYQAGSAFATLLSGEATPASLKRVGEGELDALLAATGCSPILFYWDGCSLECLAKRADEGGPAMQELGSRSVDLSRYPWGWLVYATMTREAQVDARARMRDSTLLERGLAENAAWMKSECFVFDKGVISPNQYRLATLLRTREGRLVGALGLGATPYLLPKKNVLPYGRLLVDAACRIADRLG